MTCCAIHVEGGDAMSSTSLVRSGYPRDWAAEQPAEQRRGGRSSSSSRGGFSRYVVAIGIGVGATLAWQTYGEAAREKIAGAYPQLGWLSPRAASAQTLTATAASVRSTDQQLQELASSLAAMRQRVDQLSLQVAASQDQMTRDITAKVQAAERDILDKIASAQPKPEVTAARKPAPPAQSTQLR
jgi:hypothetical protein